MPEPELTYTEFTRRRKNLVSIIDGHKRKIQTLTKAGYTELSANGVKLLLGALENYERILAGLIEEFQTVNQRRALNGGKETRETA